jgi:prevent-host-death family protein
MKTITARDAKTRFGELLDSMQREPVVITKNNRPVGIMISIEDAANTLIPDLFMEKEPGYDAWFSEKVEGALAALKTGASTAEEHDIVMQRVWGRLTQTR